MPTDRLEPAGWHRGLYSTALAQEARPIARSPYPASLSCAKHRCWRFASAQEADDDTTLRSESDRYPHGPRIVNWRQNHQLTHRSRHQSGGSGAALGDPIVVPQPIVPGPALPPHAGAPGYSASDHGDRAQTGANHIPSDHASRGLRRQHPRRRRAPRPAPL